MSKKPHDNSDNSHDAKRAPGDISSVGRGLRCLCMPLHRSDGTEVWRDGVNGPTDDMLDQSPDENGDKCYMKLVGRKEKKMREWLKYLGEEMVKASTDVERKQALQDGTLNFKLHALPTGYRLYEQILVPGPGGGKPRRDTYLYGHPKGPSKRFRSPMEFAPHVNWLTFDATKNSDNCGCKACKSKR